MKRTPKRRDSFGEDSEDSDQEENIKVFIGIKNYMARIKIARIPNNRIKFKKDRKWEKLLDIFLLYIRCQLW